MRLDNEPALTREHFGAMLQTFSTMLDIHERFVSEARAQARRCWSAVFWQASIQLPLAGICGALAVWCYLQAQVDRPTANYLACACNCASVAVNAYMLGRPVIELMKAHFELKAHGRAHTVIQGIYRQCLQQYLRMGGA